MPTTKRAIEALTVVLRAPQAHVSRIYTGVLCPLNFLHHRRKAGGIGTTCNESQMRPLFDKLTSVFRLCDYTDVARDAVMEGGL